MKLINGLHVTANEKKAIQAILKAGLKEGRVGRTDYFIEGTNPYTVRICKAVTDWFGPKMESNTITVQI